MSGGFFNHMNVDPPQRHLSESTMRDNVIQRELRGYLSRLFALLLIFNNQRRQHFIGQELEFPRPFMRAQILSRLLLEDPVEPPVLGPP